MTGTMVKQYFGEVIQALQTIPVHKIERVVDLICEAYRKGHQVFILGNGGSASTASHFCCDLSKGAVVDGKPRLRVMSLNDNMALLTAYANDMGYECVFAEQMKNLLQAEDLVICITGSGNSPNVLRAIEFAHKMRAVTIGFLGFDGGKAGKLVTEAVILDNDNYGQVEDVHMLLSHCISHCFRARVLNQEMRPFLDHVEEERALLWPQEPVVSEVLGVGKAVKAGG